MSHHQFLLGRIEDAVSHLSGDSIFHLVIVDLGLPVRPHGIADSTSTGYRHRCALRQREMAYPIPAVLVISGRSTKRISHRFESLWVVISGTAK